MSEKKDRNYFDLLFSVDCTGKTEEKNGLTYLSWTYALAEMLKRYPDVAYEVKMFDGKPYVYDENTGYMVFTSVTLDGITREMWLPVMDGANRAMKAHPYEVKTKYKSFTVDAATMFDINKTIMRCLVKNFAAFGLGLYIYAGEDLPEEVAEANKKAEEEARRLIDKTEQDNLISLAKQFGKDVEAMLKAVKVKSIDQINYDTYVKLLNKFKKMSEENESKAD